MGLLVNGQWQDRWYDTGSSGGRFVRKDAAFRNWVTVDGAPGASGHGGFQAEAGRYHLYVSLACPWAHRALIVRALKGLEETINVSVVHWLMLENGWTLDARLATSKYLAGDAYSIADMALWGWANFAGYILGEKGLTDYPHVKRLVDEISERPAGARV
jgi:glutathionyl-hydroquinone reductase